MTPTRRAPRLPGATPAKKPRAASSLAYAVTAARTSFHAAPLWALNNAAWRFGARSALVGALAASPTSGRGREVRAALADGSLRGWAQVRGVGDVLEGVSAQC